MSGHISRLVKTSAIAQSQDFLELVLVARSVAATSVPAQAVLVPSQRAASSKVWLYETGTAASGASPLSAAVIAKLVDADDGPVPSGQNSLQPGFNSALTPAALASLRSGVGAYFATAASIPAQSIGFVISGIGCTDVLGVEVQVCSNVGSAVDFIASGSDSSTFYYSTPVILSDALYPLGAGGALIGPSGSVIAPSTQPLVVVNGAVIGVIPRPAAAAAGDLIKIRLLVKC